MKVRYGLVLATSVIMSAAGCAAGGGAAAPAAPAAKPTLHGEVLEEGVRPRENKQTRAADLFLTQAQTATDTARQQEHYQQALEAAKEGIALDPDNPKSYLQAGQAYVGLNDFVGADTMFTRAEELRPIYKLETQVYREMGWVNAYNQAIQPLNEGDLEAAARLFEQANDLYQGRPEALLQLGSLYAQMGETDKAAEAYRKALEILSETKEAQLADTASAPVWKQHYEIATTGLAQVFSIAGRYEEAAQVYRDVLKDDPDNLLVLENLANVFAELAQSDSTKAFYADSARAILDEIFQRPDLDERGFYNAGVAFYQIEDYDGAAEAFRKVAEMNPLNRDAVLNLAQTLSIAEKFEELVPAARRLLELDPRNGLGWILLTRALSETDQVAEANKVFTEYQEMGFEVDNLRLQPYPDGGATLTGQVKNVSLDPGTRIVLRFHFGGEGGKEIGTLDIEIQAPEQEQFEVFRGEFESTEVVTGYRYEVITP